MEPVTHLMTGAVLARSGLNRKAAYATLAMTLAAEAPDMDVLWGLRGPVASFQHHRGWTHTFLGLPFEAALVVGFVWLIHRWRSRRARGAEHRFPGEPAPVRWPLLYGFALLALLSHLFLDWTNNYGVRPFFPFDPRWYEGSFVFIFEPVLFGLLLLALVAPWFFGLIGSEVGARRERYRGRGWATAALGGSLLLWTVRAFEKSIAENVARAGDYNGAGIERVLISPYPVNPFRWHAVVETSQFYQTGTVDSLAGTLTTSPQEDIYFKPPVTLAILAAKRSWLGEVYLDWSAAPLVTEAGQATEGEDAGLTAVNFRDLRFLYDTMLMSGREEAPLSGLVLVDDDRRIVRTEMNGEPQRSR